MDTKNSFLDRTTSHPDSSFPLAPSRWSLCCVGFAVLILACQDMATAVQPSGLPAPSTNSIALSHQGHSVTPSECSLGDAQALFNTIEIANEILVRSGATHPWAQTLLHCQYRLFWENGHPVLGQPVTFAEDDYFLGGVVAFIPYKQLGMSRAEAIDILKLIQVRTWLAKVTENEIGDLVEQPLMESAIDNSMTASFGLVVARQWGFIGQLPAGEYVSFTEFVAPVFFEIDAFWTVPLTITPTNLSTTPNP